MVKELYKTLRSLRERKGFSQEYMAGKLGMSRPTYIQIESGERELKVSEARMAAKVFDLSLEDFLAGREWTHPAVILEEKKEAERASKQEIRINIPQEKVHKFEQVLLYILAKIGGKPNIGQTVLYKLLYFIDFDYYEKYEEQLIGARYMKNTHGPTPVAFAKIVERLENEGKVEKVRSKFYKYEQTKYLVNPNIPLSLSALSAQELAHVDWEISRLGDLTAAQISALSHIDTPWVAAGEREQLEYEHVFYRPEETSVRAYEEL
jgi:transcriptional regulator with XRE-family HTH domain